jgi:hypothetical protein
MHGIIPSIAQWKTRSNGPCVRIGMRCPGVKGEREEGPSGPSSREAICSVGDAGPRSCFFILNGIGPFHWPDPRRPMTVRLRADGKGASREDPPGSERVHGSPRLGAKDRGSDGRGFPPTPSGIPLLSGGEVGSLGGPGRKGPFWERPLLSR